MRIAIIGTTAFTMLIFRKGLIKDFIADGAEVFALATDYTDQTRSAMLLLGAQPIEYSISRGGVNPFADIWHTYKLSKILKSLSVDVVFSYFSKPVIFGTFAAKLAGIKRVVGMLEGLGYAFTEQPYGITCKVNVLKKIQVFLYRLSFPLLDHVIFLNHDDSKDLIVTYKINVKDTSVLGGIGLDLNEYSFSKPTLEPVRFIFIGRILAEKGLREFVAAAEMVKHKYPKAEFIVLGNVDPANPGGLSQDILSNSVAKGLIIYPGHVESVTDWIKESSVFVLPSYREGFPRSTQEAMAMGRAVITTDVPGCRDTIVNGISGFLVKPFSVQDLAEKMVRFIEDRTLIETMGLASYKLAVEKFDEKLVNKRLAKIIRGF